MTVAFSGSMMVRGTAFSPKSEAKALKTVKVSVTLPEELYRQIKALTDNVSAFVTEGARQYLVRLRAERALEESAGAWTEEGHPDLGNLEEIANYVREIRAGWRTQDG